MLVANELMKNNCEASSVVAQSCGNGGLVVWQQWYMSDDESGTARQFAIAAIIDMLLLVMACSHTFCVGSLFSACNGERCT